MVRPAIGGEGLRGEARAALIEAAYAEFDEQGFDGTNSNTIARRAGYAPQTFYRHFADKLAIFLTVYERWAVDEASAMTRARSIEDVAETLIGRHGRHIVFRRSARCLAVENPSVAYVMTQIRKEQLTVLAKHSEAFAGLPLAEQVTILLTVERLCEALADGEFAALEVSGNEARAIIRCRLVSISAAALTEG